MGFRDKGAIFENIIFMKIKNKSPKYLYSSGQEIDFLFDDNLLEVKYHRELEGKQRDFFDAYPIKNKLILKNYFDFLKVQKKFQ